MEQIEKRHQSNNQSGFTLIEIMLVTIIIGILGGMVVMVFQGTAVNAKINTALGDIRSYQSSLDMFALENNDKYPESLNALVNGKKKYIRDLNKDPWGNAYIYMKPGQRHPESFDLFSAGPDGTKGTEDDVAPWLKSGKE